GPPRAPRSVWPPSVWGATARRRRAAPARCSRDCWRKGEPASPGGESPPGALLLRGSSAAERGPCPAEGAEDGGERRPVLLRQPSAGRTGLVVPAELHRLLVVELGRRSAAPPAAHHPARAVGGVGPGPDRPLQRAGDALQSPFEEVVALREALHLAGEITKDLLQWGHVPQPSGRSTAPAKSHLFSPTVNGNSTGRSKIWPPRRCQAAAWMLVASQLSPRSESNYWESSSTVSW